MAGLRCHLRRVVQRPPQLLSHSEGSGRYAEARAKNINICVPPDPSLEAQDDNVFIGGSNAIWNYASDFAA